MILRILSIAITFINVSAFAQWQQRANTPFTKDHGIGFSLDGYGYVLTGGANGQVFSATKDFFKYDPSTDSWEQLPDYPGPNRGYGIGDVWNGKVYFGFGLDGNTYLNDLWSWDPATDMFVQLPSCPCDGRVHPAFVISNGKIYVGAGGNTNGDLADFWEYDISTQAWTQIPSIPGNRHHPYQFAIDGDIYVGNGHLPTWFRYTPGSTGWVMVEPLVARVAGAQFSYNGKGYALSGADINHNVFGTGEFWEYDPIADTWTALPPHPGTSRFGPTQFVIDNYIYILAGYERNDPTFTMIPLSTMWRYELSPSLDVDEVGEEVVGSVYPNPTENTINIDLNKELSTSTIINIYSVSGQLMMSLPFQESIDISSLSDGMYILDVLEDELSVWKKRITKQ